MIAFEVVWAPVCAAWNTPENGNPVVPGYFADPSIMYDSTMHAFYIYSTTDGVWISYSGQPQVWTSADFVQWKCHTMMLPSFWPTAGLWAPSAIRHPTNGKYYLLYCTNPSVYIAYSSSPLGPWTNAVSGNNPLYTSGQLTGSSDWIDPQFFVDTNSVYFSFGQSSNMGIAKLAFNATTFFVTIDGADSRMVDGVAYKCKHFSGLSNNLEGSCMFKAGNTYFITYSNSACQNYNVQYAYASSPVGPFTYGGGRIVERDNAENILGPGHNSILHYGNNWYICYHRQFYQYVDVKRQTCINQFTISGNALSADVQTQEGVWAGSGSLETLVAKGRVSQDTDLAFGKIVAASSESAFKGGTAGNQTETFAAVNAFYAARYAVDRNNGTRWAPSSLPGYLIVDLGANYSVGTCEATFEYILRPYKYRIEYLAQSEASSISAAQSSTTWHIFADRSQNTVSVSPITDTGNVSARYMKITVLSAALPTALAEIKTIVETDNADRVSIVEFKVFKSRVTPVVNERFNPMKTVYCTSQKLRVFTVVNVLGKTVYSGVLQEKSDNVASWFAKLPLSHGIYFYGTTKQGQTSGKLLACLSLTNTIFKNDILICNR